MIVLKHKELSDEVIGCFYTVYNTLSFGFLEHVYQNALVDELRSKGIKVEVQYPIQVKYNNKVVGKFYADIIVEGKIILELKATPLLARHELQIFNYLEATDIEVGYLLSFGKEAKFNRMFFSTERKKKHFARLRNAKSKKSA